MKVINNEMVAMWDVDDTLVLWKHPTQPSEGSFEFTDPHDGTIHFLHPHTKHIKLLMDFKARGYTNIVWSGGGYAWAQAVVETLSLEDYVDFVMTKPSKYIDDLHAPEILGSRIYLKDE